ncbi:MAG: hypothetical protein JSW08_02020 [archaeon]|nr:MAG: hypothetical protein JSW08_02020 [archaeon]
MVTAAELRKRTLQALPQRTAIKRIEEQEIRQLEKQQEYEDFGEKLSAYVKKKVELWGDVTMPKTPPPKPELMSQAEYDSLVKKANIAARFKAVEHQVIERKRVEREKAISGAVKASEIFGEKLKGGKYPIVSTEKGFAVEVGTEEGVRRIPIEVITEEVKPIEMAKDPWEEIKVAETIPKKPSAWIGLPEKRPFFERVKEEGLVRTGLQIIGTEARKIGEKWGGGGFTLYGEPEPYQIQASGRLFQTTATVAPFLIPGVGAPLLLGLGVEHVAMPGGRREIKLIGEKLEEEYKVPSELAWGIPVAEIAIGTWGTFGTRIQDIVRTRGRQRIEAERIIPRDVLTGRTLFPEAAKRLPPYQRARYHLQLFRRGRYRLPGYDVPGGYHAAGEPWGSLIVGGEEGVVAHIAHGVSPHFMRISGSASFLPKTSFIEQFQRWIYPEITTAKPQVMYITPKGFKAQVGVEFERGFYNWFGRPTKPGIAYVPGTKAEVQAALIAGTELEKIGERFYFLWKPTGAILPRRVPIDEFKVVGMGDPLTRRAITTIGEVAPSYYLPPKVSYIFKPGYGVSSLISSQKYVTGVSSIISYVSKPSYPLKSYISKPSPILKYSAPSYVISKPSVSYAISVPVSPSKYISPSKPTSYLRTPSTYKRPEPYIPYVPPPKPSSQIKPKKKIPDYIGRKGYKLYIKRYGKWKPVTGIFAKGKAILKGVEWARKTLGAGFKIKETEQYISTPTVPVREPGIMFRKHKIRKGRKIGLRDEWIQKAKYRLGTRSEIREIQAARKARSKRKRKLLSIKSNFFK